MEKKKDNNFLNLIINIGIPFVLLTKFSDEKYLGPVNGLILSILIPLLYGLYELIFHKKTNFISILGLVSIALTGGISLLKLPAEYIAIKESFIPFVIGVVVLVLIKTKYPLFNKMIYRNELFDIDKVEEIIAKEKKEPQLKRVLVNSNIFLSFSFFLSAVLNYVLAIIIVKSEPGSIAYNNELGQMQLYSWPVIVAPSLLVMFLILFYFLSAIKKLTGLTNSEIMRG